MSSKTFFSSKVYVYVHNILFPFKIVALRTIVINTPFCECFILTATVLAVQQIALIYIIQ